MDPSRLKFDTEDMTEEFGSEKFDLVAGPSQACPSPGAIAHLKGNSSDSVPPQFDNDVGYELDRPAMTAKLMNHIKLHTLNTPFHVSTYTSLLCYGSLMDPEVLQAVLDLRAIPTMRDGWVEGYAMKKWGIYPTAIPPERVDNPWQSLENCLAAVYGASGRVRDQGVCP